MGLGDALYLQSVVRHFVERGNDVEACCNWPDVFRPLAGKVTVSQFRRSNVTRLAHYTTRKNIRGTTQFEDCCINAGITEKVDLRLDWRQINNRWNALATSHSPVILVQMPREPFGRNDGFGKELLPDCAVIQRAIDKLRGRALLVQVGAGKPSFRFDGIDIDLVNQTSVCDLLDLGYIADGLLGYCSFIVPLAESFSKPTLLVWARRGLQSRTRFISSITPQKILHRASSRFVVDDCSDVELTNAVGSLHNAARSQRAL